MMAAKGWAAKEVLDAYTRVRVLCEELDDERELFIALRGEGQYRMIRGESRIVVELGERCVALAASSKDPGVNIEAHHLKLKPQPSRADTCLRISAPFVALAGVCFGSIAPSRNPERNRKTRWRLTEKPDGRTLTWFHFGSRRHPC